MNSLVRSVLAIGAVAIFAMAGCQSQSEFEYDALDLAPPHEELTEFNLGKYSIPIPLAGHRRSKELGRANRMRLEFELFVVISPRMVSHIAEDWARHEGKIRDNVIRVCRNASVEELQDPELATLKSRLMDVLAMQMGKQDVRQLLITDVMSQEL